MTSQTQSPKPQVSIGTRKGDLALWQAEYVADQLRAHFRGLQVTFRHVVTHGDRVIDKPLPEIGGKGVFTAELESALRTGEIDLAVHSLKDLPTQLDAAFVIAAVPERAAPFDVLISRGGYSLFTLPPGATVGTSSLRRSAQVKASRPDLNTMAVRGNVPTRIDKARRTDGPYDAILLAYAGLDRLGLDDQITEILPPELMLPAPAQGALAVQCRADDEAMRNMLAPLDHADTRRAVEAERAFLNRLDSGCRLPVAALAWVDGVQVQLTGRVCSLDGSQVITVSGEAARGEAVALGNRLADAALARGAGDLLAAIRLSETN